MSNMMRRSRRTSTLALFVTLALCLSLAPPARPAAPPRPTPVGQEPGTFKENIDVNLVNVDLVAVDKSGKLVTDLNQEDFQVTDDGKKVKVDFFARMNAAGAVVPPSDAAPETGLTPTSLGTIRDERSFIVFIDLDSTLPTSRNRVLDDVASYLTASTEPMSTMVVTYGGTGLDIKQPFTSVAAEWKAAIDAAKQMPSRGQMRHAEQQRLVESIRAIHLNADDSSSMQAARAQADELMGSVRTEAEAMLLEGRVTLRALQTLVSVLSTVEGRKSLLYVGDGVPVHPGEELYHLLADVFESDRRFAQPAGPAQTSPNPGSDRPRSGEPTAGGTSEDTSSFGALEQGVTEMSQSTQTLRADSMSYDLTAEIRALTATANSHRVTIYGLSADTQGGAGRADMNLGGRVSPTASLSYDVSRSQIREQSLQLMAEETGGLALPPSAGVDAFLDRVMADEDNRYSLAYLSPHDGDSKFHRIKVKVNRKGVELRHREGYIDRPRDVRIGDLVAGALLLGSGENPHQLEMEIASQQPGQNDETAVTLALHIPLDQLNLVPAGDNHEAKLDLYVLTKDESGAFAPMRYVAFTVTLSPDQMTQAKGKFYGATLPVSLKKGPHAIAVGLVEPSVQRTSVVRTELEVGG